jgi:hypothetical protein
LTFSNKWLLLLVGDCPIRQLVLSEKDFGWIALWELNPELLTGSAFVVNGSLYI